MNIKCRAACFTALLMLCLVFAVFGREDMQEITNVRILAGNKAGSGVVYAVTDEDVIIVSAKHVLENNVQAESGEGAAIAEQVKIVFDSRTEILADMVLPVEGLDLVFLTVDRSILGNLVFPDVMMQDAQGSIAEENLELAQTPDGSRRLTVYGYDKEGILVRRQGEIVNEWIYVEDFQNYMLIGNAAAEAGMSGGGVFDLNGNFLGILCGMDDAGRIAVLPAVVIAGEYSAIF